MRWGEMARAQASDISGSVLTVHRTKSGKVRRLPLTQNLVSELRNRVGLLIPLRNGQGVAEQVRRRTGIEGLEGQM